MMNDGKNYSLKSVDYQQNGVQVVLLVFFEYSYSSQKKRLVQ